MGGGPGCFTRPESGPVREKPVGSLRNQGGLANRDIEMPSGTRASVVPEGLFVLMLAEGRITRKWDWNPWQDMVSWRRLYAGMRIGAGSAPGRLARFRGGNARMGGSKTAFGRLVGVFVCVLAVSWVFLPKGLMAASKSAEYGGTLAAARLSGKLTLEFSSSYENSEGDMMKLGMAFDGKLRLPAGAGISCDITAGARPNPAGCGLLGYAAVAFAAKPGGGLRLDLDARRSRTSESDDAAEPGTERISSTVRAALAWKSPSGRMSTKVVWEEEGAAYPYRPASDHGRREVSGEVRVVPGPWMSALVGLNLIDREYRIAPYKSSTTRVSRFELGVKQTAKLGGKVRLERKHAAYPGSRNKTYDQHTREITLSWDPRPRLSVGLILSHIDKEFPFAREKDLRDREIAASLSMGGTVVGTLTVEGTVFERKVPASTKKEYRAQSIGAEAELPMGDRLSLCAGCVLSRKAYADPEERDEDYSETEVTWKLTYDLSQDIDITYEAEIKRREYPLRETKNTHRFKSRVTLVYRF